MSRITNPCWWFSCALLLGWASTAMARDAGRTGGEAFWVSDDGRRQARRTPTHLVLAHIIGIAEQRVLLVNCFVGADKAFRRGEFVPRKGAEFEWAIDVICPAGLLPDVGFGPVEYRVDSGVGGTDSTGVGTFSASLMAQDLPQGAQPHDHVFLATVSFVNQKRVVRTVAGCTVMQEPP